MVAVDWQPMSESAGLAHLRQGDTDEMILMLFAKHEANVEEDALVRVGRMMRHLPGFPLDNLRESLHVRRPLALAVYVCDGGGFATLSAATQMATAYFLGRV